MLNIIISLGIWIAIFVITFFAYLSISLFSLLFGRFDPDAKFSHAQGFWWSRSIVSVNPFWKFNISGIENIKKDTAYILACNHQSMADIILICRIEKQFKWVAKESLFKIPVFGGCLRGAKYVNLKREDRTSIKEANKQIIYWLRRGISVCIFPEGTRSHDGRLQEFKNGAFKIAIKEKIPIIPIAIKGTFDALPKGSWVFSKHVSIEVKILAPIDTSNYTVGDFAVLRDLVRGEIQSALREEDVKCA